MRILGALMLTLGLVACGGGSKPAAQEPANEEEASTDPLPEDVPDGELCCCDYIEETGDGDNMAENQTYSMMPPSECEGMGQCTDSTSCTTEE